ncbi:mevalonate kinase [Listeria grayi]|nr:mevalonate kinase [Listeria grayi]
MCVSMKHEIKVKVPGKLYVAGEYAVVESGNTAVLTAVDKYISLTLTDHERNELWIPHYKEPVSWEIGDELKPEGEHWVFTAEAINIVTTYLRKEGIALSPVKLVIETELIDDSGAKYGLGSSAAATVAVVNALTARFAPETSIIKRFKLAALSHLVVQGNGSCGDIASCMYGGWIAYTTFDQEWVKHRLAYKTLDYFLETDWPQLKIEPLESPEMIFSVGWTGNPVSTGKLVSQIAAFKAENHASYQEFIEGTKKAVKKILTAFREKNNAILIEAITENRLWLQKLGQSAGVEIETALLRKLADSAKELGGVGKSSGSGGGDCGIAFSKTKEAALQLKEAWKALGIQPLPFKEGTAQIQIN